MSAVAMLLLVVVVWAISAARQTPHAAEAYLVNVVLVVRHGGKYARMLDTLTGSSPWHFFSARSLHFFLEAVDTRDVERGFLVSHPYKDATRILEDSHQLWQHQTISAEVEPPVCATNTRHPSFVDERNLALNAFPDEPDSGLYLIGLVMATWKLPFPDGETPNARFVLDVLPRMISGVASETCHCYYKPLGIGSAALNEGEVLLGQLRAITE